MACQVIETENSIEFVYHEKTGDTSVPPPPIVTAASRNAVNGYVYVGDCGAPLGHNECLRLAEWLIQQANAEGTRRANGEQDLLMQLRMRPYSNPSYWMLEAADTIERLQSAYDGLTPAQYHAGLSKLWAALGNPPMDGRDVFTRVADEIVGLQAIITAKLHLRRCHDCGHVGRYADSRTPYCLCEQCKSQNTRLAKEEK